MSDSSPPPSSSIPGFIRKWKGSAASERANKDLFLAELCTALGVPKPSPATGDAARDEYVFEKAVRVPREGGTTTKFIDLYKRGCFVFEAKQGSEANSGKLGAAKRNTPAWNVAMNAAFGQALEYASFLEEQPPFILIADIGHCFDLYASFDGTARYRPFPNALAHRIHFSDLGEQADLLRSIFLNPLALDPSKVAVDVTREVAGHLAELSRRLEKAGHAPNAVADFLMRCIFTMFAEDVGLLPDELFTKELRAHWIESPRSFPAGVENLWRAMNDGTAFGFFEKLLHFNGGLFRSPSALQLDKKDLQVLLEAASCGWSKVEPAIFGTLFERALDKRERHSLGAHFTPRAYVERLVRPTLEEPLREDWNDTQAKVRALAAANKINDAKIEMRAFMKRLAGVRVLDPACGSGNFLYVALDLMKGIEDEAFALLLALEKGQTDLCLDAPEVTPRQFLGIELNPRAKSIAELVLWIGYLQWHFRTKHRGGKPREPVLEDYRNIENRDAVLDYDDRELERDERTGRPATRWDGETMKKHAVTGKPVPDDRFTAPVFRYVNARKAAWPSADFVVGNPPFVGNKRMRAVLGNEYTECLRNAHDDVPETSDFVGYWWNHAAALTRAGKLRQFGLITSNSIGQAQGRKLLEQHLSRGLSLVFAVDDHPWVNSTDGAAVRISMTVGRTGEHDGRLLRCVRESEGADGVVEVDLEKVEGRINGDLSVGADVASARPLAANAGICFQGYILVGKGFCVGSDELARLGVSANKLPPVIRPWKNGRDLLQTPTNRYVIDFFGLEEDEARAQYPRLFQHVLTSVKPIRDQVARKNHKERWWIWGEARPGLRRAIAGLKRVVVTNFAAKHRVFVFEPPSLAIDHNMYIVATDDAFALAVLSSRAHVQWMLTAGSTLEDRPLWINSTCFQPFPFPAVDDQTRERIAAAGEALDSHRKRVQREHPEITLTAMYNVLAKLRAEHPLTIKEHRVHDLGLVSLLQRLHEELDTVVLDAYGWAADLSDSQLIHHLVALNTARLAEERAGRVHWLRPQFQDKKARPEPTSSRPGLAKGPKAPTRFVLKPTEMKKAKPRQEKLKLKVPGTKR